MAHDKPHLDAAQSRQILDRFRVEHGTDFRLNRFPTDGAAPNIIDKADAKLLLKDGIQRLAAHQELLYANANWSLLIVFQAMDAAGKDSSIKHVMSGINPQGVVVTSFKQPGPEALAHDFLWRVSAALPARGMIGIFNRSHYEEVLVTRVHPDLLDGVRDKATPVPETATSTKSSPSNKLMARAIRVRRTGRDRSRHARLRGTGLSRTLGSLPRSAAL